MVRFCKEELDIESVTVVTNGSKVVLQEIHPMQSKKSPHWTFSVTVFLTPSLKVTEQWMRDFGYYLDILAVSCDSFKAEVGKSPILYLPDVELITI